MAEYDEAATTWPRIHQRLYKESRSSVAGKFAEVEARLDVFKIRLLTLGVVVVHIRGEYRPKGQLEEMTKNIVTAVMQRREDEWEIVTFHNAPVQKREGEDTEFVIQIEGVDENKEARR